MFRLYISVCSVETVVHPQGEHFFPGWCGKIILEYHRRNIKIIFPLQNQIQIQKSTVLPSRRALIYFDLMWNFANSLIKAI